MPFFSKSRGQPHSGNGETARIPELSETQKAQALSKAFGYMKTNRFVHDQWGPYSNEFVIGKSGATSEISFLVGYERSTAYTSRHKGTFLSGDVVGVECELKEDSSRANRFVPASASFQLSRTIPIDYQGAEKLSIKSGIFERKRIAKKVRS